MGLRLGEICALKWEDIDFQRKTIHINRTVQRIQVGQEDKKTILYEGPPKNALLCPRDPDSGISLSTSPLL